MPRRGPDHAVQGIPFGTLPWARRIRRTPSRDFPDRPLWGDTHLQHGADPVDAGLFGCRPGLEEAYRFARGEEVISSTGQPVKLARPLDWLVIADHSDAMGFIQDLAAGVPEILAFEEGKRWSQGLQAGGEASVAAALDLITTFAQGKIPQELLIQYSPGAKKYASTWDKVVKAAEDYNEPGRFVTLIGFEWTSLVDGNNLHRNVVFRDGADKVGQVVPFTTQAPIGSTDPLDLYRWLENYEAKTGGTALCAGPQRQSFQRADVPGRRPVHGSQTRRSLRQIACPVGAPL